jgi:hypothetical protein
MRICIEVRNQSFRVTARHDQLGSLLSSAQRVDAVIDQAADGRKRTTADGFGRALTRHQLAGRSIVSGEPAQIAGFFTERPAHQVQSRDNVTTQVIATDRNNINRNCRAGIDNTNRPGIPVSRGNDREPPIDTELAIIVITVALLSGLRLR